MLLLLTHATLSCCCWCADAYHQGKSFILNQLLQTTGGFQIGSTTRPCTKGLWMWSTPQRTLDEVGKEYHIVSRAAAPGPDTHTDAPAALRPGRLQLHACCCNRVRVRGCAHQVRATANRPQQL